jgi:hypothetical protein
MAWAFLPSIYPFSITIKMPSNPEGIFISTSTGAIGVSFGFLGTFWVYLEMNIKKYILVSDF